MKHECDCKNISGTFAFNEDPLYEYERAGLLSLICFRQKDIERKSRPLPHYQNKNRRH